jgi:hypothetical protein
MPAAAVESAADVPRSSARRGGRAGALVSWELGMVVRCSPVCRVSYSYEVCVNVSLWCPFVSYRYMYIAYEHVCVCQRHNCVSYNPLPCVLCVSYVCPDSPRCLCIVSRAPGIHAPSGSRLPRRSISNFPRSRSTRHDAAPLRGVCALQPTIRRSAAASHAMLATEWGFRPRRPM